MIYFIFLFIGKAKLSGKFPKNLKDFLKMMFDIRNLGGQAINRELSRSTLVFVLDNINLINIKKYVISK